MTILDASDSMFYYDIITYEFREPALEYLYLIKITRSFDFKTNEITTLIRNKIGRGRLIAGLLFYQFITANYLFGRKRLDRFKNKTFISIFKTFYIFTFYLTPNTRI